MISKTLFLARELTHATAWLSAGAPPDDYSDDAAHYVWAWIDKESGRVRTRMFAPELGVPEDEATGAAALFALSLYQWLR